MDCPFMSTAASKAPCSQTCALHLRGGCALVLNAQLAEELQKKTAASLERIDRLIRQR